MVTSQLFALICPKCQGTGVHILHDRYATRVCGTCGHRWSRHAERQWVLSDAWEAEFDDRRNQRKIMDAERDRVRRIFKEVNK